ncbi:SMODS domain-containing nucleotidyltransferase [Streptomyces griseorubiginosus]|uniref:SMODS domain-containing nucleotidyltransferase n=1 Tax=Streptomyces griseorubiginosus TaxID=67304 RepID=UPI0036F0FB0E
MDQIDSAFCRFYEAITPPDSCLQLALSRVREFATHLPDTSRTNAPKYTFLGYRLMGSYSRGTAIRQSSDVDVLFVFTDPDSSRADDSLSLLTHLEERLREFSGGAAQFSRLREVVSVSFPGEVSIDILPCIKSGKDGYLFPGGSGRWAMTDPDSQNSYFTERRDAAGIDLSKFTRGIKQWNVENGGALRSYHLEVMVAAVADKLGDDYASATTRFYEIYANGLSVQDPAGQQGDLSAYLTTRQRESVSTLIKNCGRTAHLAISAQNDRRYAQAVDAWTKIYGTSFSSTNKQ